MNRAPPDPAGETGAEEGAGGVVDDVDGFAAAAAGRPALVGARFKRSGG